MAATMSTTMYAGFWRRFAAWILDGLLLSLVTVPFTLQFGGDAAAGPLERPQPARSRP